MYLFVLYFFGLSFCNFSA